MSTYQPIAKASFSSASYAYSPLLSDGDDVVSRTGLTAAGLGILKRGTILHMDPATGAITQPVLATDCNCILSNDTDATLAAAATVYVSGKFKADAIIWPAALGHGVVSDALRDYMILIESVVFTDGTLVKTAPSAAEAQAAQAVVQANRDNAAKTAPGKTAEEPKPTMDSPYAYLTAEEREKHPELADVPTISELAAAMPDVPPVTLAPTFATVPAEGGSGSIAVTITGPGTSGTYTVDKDADATWLTFTPTEPQSTSGTVNYTAEANTGAARTAHFYINGKTFTVDQAAPVARHSHSR